MLGRKISNRIQKMYKYKKSFIIFLKSHLKTYKWIENSKFKKKNYTNYSEYLSHQKVELPLIDLSEYDIKYRNVLRERLKKQNVVKHGMNVLCLGARIGTEVKSFLDLGCFAVGIDLNLGKENKYVVYGDFHKIQFSSKTLDVVFTNSLDHVFDIYTVIKEIKRVLKPQGYLLLEIARGESTVGYWESLSWQSIEDVIKLFTESGFEVINKVDFEYPWKGTLYLLALTKSSEK